MDFIRSVLYIGEKDDFYKSFTEQLKGITKKITISNCSERSQLSELIAKQNFTAIFIMMADKAECLYCFRLLGLHKMKANPELKIFFTSSNFETFQEIVDKIALSDVEVYPWPQEPKELADKMADKIFDKQMSKEIVTKSNGKVTIDLEFIQVFVQSTRKVLEEMGDVQDIAHQKPRYIEQMEKPIEEGVSSKIMISSEYFKGNFYVIFPTPTFLKLYANAVYEEHDKLNDENIDFAGELANIIYGQSKKIFSAAGLNLDMAIPSIHRSTKVESEVVVVIPFDTSIGNFYIAVAPGEL